MADYVVEFGRDGRPVEPDGRLDAPAFHRNHQAIRSVLQRVLGGQSGEVIEVGSGTGQHVVDFARHFPDIMWWPSDLNEAHLKSIAAWRAKCTTCWPVPLPASSASPDLPARNFCNAAQIGAWLR